MEQAIYDDDDQPLAITSAVLVIKREQDLWESYGGLVAVSSCLSVYTHSGGSGMRCVNEGSFNKNKVGSGLVGWWGWFVGGLVGGWGWVGLGWV